MAPRTPEQLPEGKREQPKGMLEAVKEAARKGVGALKQQVEEYKEKPHGTYTFERSAYENVDTKTDFERSYKYLVLQTGAAKIDVFLKGVADNTTFQLDPKNPNQVDLNRGADFQTKFLHALTTLKSTGGVIGLGGLDFNKDGLKAVHKLPLNEQQKVMNHAIAYLRAERLQRDLQNVCKGNPPINFLITTEWARDSKTRKATMMDVVVTKDLSTEEMLEKARGQSVRPATKEDIPPLLRKDAPKQKYEGGKYWGKTEYPKKPEQRKPDADLDDFLSSPEKQSVMPNAEGMWDKDVQAKADPIHDVEDLLDSPNKQSVDTDLLARSNEQLLEQGQGQSVRPAKIGIPPLLNKTPPKQKYEGGKYWGTTEYPKKPAVKPEQRKPDADLDDFLASPKKQSVMPNPNAEGMWDKGVQAKAYKKPKVKPVRLGPVSREGIWDKGVQAKADPINDNEDFLAGASKDKQSVLPPAAPKKPVKAEIPPLLRKEAPEQKYKGGKYWGTTEYPKKPTEAKSAYDQLSPAEQKIVDDSLGRMAPPAPSARMEEQLRQAGLKSAVPPAAKPLEWKPTDYRAAAKELPDLPNDGFTVRKKQTPPPGFEK
ncbi:MAG: hypothetical protein WCT53_02525 [Candidatus Gracilibacteria bacterium]